MADFENDTPFGVHVMPSCDRDGRDVLLIVVAAHFELPEPGYDHSVLRLLRAQEPPPMVDEYVGEPGRSSMRRDAQSSYTKPATDIWVCGDACAPEGRPVTSMTVGIRVGPCRVDLHVYGNRIWERNATVGARPSSPASFVSMPLVWERAFGGVAATSTEQHPLYEPRNPIGCGLEADVDAAIGRAVPNIEDPRQLLEQVSDRPRPMGVGPIARHWQPRVSFAGTYDEAWKRHRAPLWPHDFDERFFCSAPDYLQASPQLKGGERVRLQGLHPAGTIDFVLPPLRLRARSHFLAGAVDTALTLDGVAIETDVKRLTMYYRSSVAAPRALAKHRVTRLRLAQRETAGSLP